MAIRDKATGPAGARVNESAGGDLAAHWHALATDPAGRADLTVTASGDEQLINTFTTGSQVGPIMARGGSGNVAVAWVSIGQDGDSSGVYMRVYAPNGNAVIGEIRVNQATAGAQNAPSITALDNGNFVVAWQQRVVLNPPPQTTFMDQVFYRVYSPNGTPITNELTANSAIHKSEGLPSVAAIEGGGFAISWSVEFDDGRNEIFVRTFSDAGVANGNEQFANTVQNDTQTGSRIAGLDGGGFIVIWEDRQGSMTTVKAQRFASDGSLVGGEFAAQAQAGVTERVNDVIGLVNGGFAILLSRDSTLYARIFDANGIAVGGEKVIATGASSTGSELTPLATGGFAAGWDTLGGDVHGRLFDAAGNPVSDEFTANQTTSLTQGFVELVERADGSLLYAWSGNGTGDSAGVFTRAFSAGNVTTPPIVGTEGDNNLAGTAGDDVMDGLGGNDLLSGGTGDDRLNGGDGNDVLYGEGGLDTTDGGAGDDVHVLDASGDLVIEAAGGGNDLVFTQQSYALAPGVSVETLSTHFHGGIAAIDLTGNEVAQTIIGNNGANVIDGGGGADTMYGLGGGDTYLVDNVGDLVVELEGQGNDVVFTSVSHTLTNGNEIETLSTVFHQGTTAIDLGGNDYANHLIGNYGDNYLNGGGGADLLTGLAGNDTYVIDNVGDQVEEQAGFGNDAVLSFVSYTLAAGQEVETLSTTFHAGTGAINLTGNNLAQTIIGNNGANVLNGGGGNDVLIGFGGADVFTFDTALGAGNIVAIADFAPVDDVIWLEDAIFTAVGAPGALAAGAFVTGTAAGDADDRIIYNSTTGALFYDADGNGAGAMVQFATLSTGLSMTAADFVVV